VTLTEWYLMTLNAILWKAAMSFDQYHPSMLGAFLCSFLIFFPAIILNQFSFWNEL